MKYFFNPSTDPHYNLALEEYVLTNCKDGETYFLLWQNEPSIIVGKHQNTVEEINSDYVKNNNIHVVRRLSGGGAVYHDLGNLNFTFIISNSKENMFDFGKFTLPIVKMLKSYGVNAQLNGRNDLTIDDKKFSGNSQYIKNGKLLHHGTLLFNSNLEDVQKSLMVSTDKIESKGIKSIRSRVTNIIEHMDNKINVLEFKDKLADYVKENDDHWEAYSISDKNITEIKDLVDLKYNTWEWNYGESPQFNYKSSKRFASGKLEVLLDIKDGKIKSCKFYGDFFSNESLPKLEKSVVGKRYEKEEIYRTLNSFSEDEIIMGISTQEILTCMFD